MKDIAAPRPPRDDHEAWLSVTQGLLHDVRWEIQHGRSESACAIIQKYWDSWREAPLLGEDEK